MSQSIPLDQSPVRVLVVDDSAFMRYTITKHLSETPGIVVAGAARDGRDALDLIPKLLPDVITMDVEMPRMDGLSTLREVMTRYPRPVVMVSSLTKEGAVETIQALTLGAVDFIAKPAYKASINLVLDELVEKIRRAAKARVSPISRESMRVVLQPSVPVSVKKVRPLGKNDKVVVIGSSTGGPRALNTVLPGLPKDLPAAVLIIQHMPVGFTRSLAERLDSVSMFSVKEAEPGDTLESGKCLLAPGGFHMVLNENHIALNQNPAMHGVRPAVDVTMFSLAKTYGIRCISVILTGMGNDGTNGSALIHAEGGWVIAEAEESSVVWGMPRSVVEAGVADEVVPLPKVAEAIMRAAEK